MSHTVKPTKKNTFLKKVNESCQSDGRSEGVKNGIKNGYLSSKLVNEKPLGKIIGTSNFRLRRTNIGSR